MSIFNIFFPKFRHIYFDKRINLFKYKIAEKNILKNKIIKGLNFQKKNTFFASSARSLILAIFKSLNLKKNQYVILPTYSCTYLNLISNQFSDNIIYCNYNNDTTYLKSELLEIIKNNNIIAIFFSPLFGNDESYNTISIIKEKKIKIIYDHCQSIRIKNFMDITDYDIYSFNLGKQISGTGGGALNTNESINSELFIEQSFFYYSKRFLYFLIFSKYRRFFFLFIKFLERNKFLDYCIGKIFSRDRSKISMYKMHKIDFYLTQKQIKYVFHHNKIILNNFRILKDIFKSHNYSVNNDSSLCTKFIIKTKNNKIKKQLCKKMRSYGIEYETLYKPHSSNNNIFFEDLYLNGISLPNNHNIKYENTIDKLNNLKLILEND